MKKSISSAPSFSIRPKPSHYRRNPVKLGKTREFTQSEASFFFRGKTRTKERRRIRRKRRRRRRWWWWWWRRCGGRRMNERGSKDEGNEFAVIRRPERVIGRRPITWLRTRTMAGRRFNGQCAKKNQWHHSSSRRFRFHRFDFACFFYFFLLKQRNQFSRPSLMAIVFFLVFKLIFQSRASRLSQWGEGLTEFVCLFVFFFNRVSVARKPMASDLRTGQSGVATSKRTTSTTTSRCRPTL